MPIHPSSAPIVELDVRPDLRAGREPFGRIMAAVKMLRATEILRLRATFEPVPLFHVLSSEGFLYESREDAPDDWSVWFWKPAAASPNAVLQGPTSTNPENHPVSVPPSAAAELDVRVIPPRDKHPTIFRTLEALRKGEALLLLNDHDPRPLRYQLDAEHPGGFDWVYEAEGPELWRVRISRL